MKQFGKIFRFELKQYLKNKIFVGITVFLVLAIAVVMWFPRVTALLNTEDDSESAPTERPLMLVKTDGYAHAETVRSLFTAVFSEYEVCLTDESTEAVCEAVTQRAAGCAFVLTSPTSYVYYVETLSMYDMNTEIANEALQQAYRLQAMIEGGMTAEEADAILSLQIIAEVESLGKDQMQNFFYTYIMIFALYMVILLYGQMVATNVATEKSSRAMELLITSAKPTSMMFGKVLASCLAGLIQLVAVFGSALLFYPLNRSYWGENPIVASIFNIPPELLIYMLIFFVLGFLMYAFLFGAIGSTASKLEDINTSVMPITMLFIVGFMVVMFSMSAGTVDGTVMRICSYVPFTSPMAMFTRIAMSTVSLYEIILSITILILSTAGVGVLSAKIYRMGVLLYGTPPKLSAILRALWKT